MIWWDFSVEPAWRWCIGQCRTESEMQNDFRTM